jgi:hypothetical protein
MKSALRDWFWPLLPGRCLRVSIAVWPCVAILTELVAVPLAPLTRGIDFGLAASNVTAPVCWIYGMVLWFRGFLLRRNNFGRVMTIVIALVTLPVWFLAIAVTTFLLFPLGRISSNF